MGPGRRKDLVAAASALGALVLGGFLFLRSQGLLGTTWTDGSRAFGSETADAVRHAVWDAPEPLAGLGEAADPTLSLDGRWLVFASGERGLNAELFVAERTGAGFGPPAPLAELNTPFDELAPAFAADALLFASDRPGGSGGLDLWRAPFADGRFGAPEPVGPGVNSPRDDTDPAPRPGAFALVFASDRGGAGFDLFEAELDADGFFAPVALEALNGPRDERGPAFAPDARTLYFGVAEADGTSALLRAHRFPGLDPEWHAPAPVPLRAAPPSARGPWPAADGFTLLLETSDADGTPALALARSLELLRVPPPAVTLAQWLTLVALALLALLALLSKRWHALDILYKCLLVSLILHLLLMLWLRTVVPDPDTYRTGPGEGPTFRVRLAPSERAGTLEARLGPAAPSAPERASFAPEAALAAQPAPAELAAPARADAPAPARDALAAAAPAAPPTARLADREAPLAAFDGTAPELALAAPATADRADPEVASAPLRAAGADAPQAAPAPDAARLEAVDASRTDLARGAPRSAEVARSATDVAGPALVVPAEPVVRAGGAAPALALESAALARVPVEDGSAPDRAELGGAAPRATLEGVQPAAAALERVSASSRALERGTGETPALARPGGPSAPPGPALATPAESFERAAGSAPALALDAARAAAAQSAEAAAPEREAFAARADGVGAATPDATPGTLATLAAPERAPGSAPAPERLRAPAADAAAAGPLAAVRSPAEAAPERAGAGRPAFDATAGLAPADLATPEAAPARPVRAAAGTADATPPAALPGPARLAASPVARAEDPAPAPERALATPGPAAELARAPDLRAPDPASVAAPAPTPAPAFDATAGLGPATLGRVDAAPAAPDRARFAAPLAESPAQPRPAALPLAAPERARVPDATPPRLAETPYQNRFGAQKLRALEEFGGSAETEQAVAAGLAYLARIQGEDGAWGDASDRHSKYLDVRIGKSALALLAFLGAGHVPGGATEHAAVVERAVARLLAEQDAATGHFGRSCSYGHGIATYALAECYALTRDERLVQPLERAIGEILRHQSDVRDPRFFGGWGYYFADGHVWNRDEWPRTSVTAWQVMALESARLGGLAVPDEAFAAARDFLVNTWDSRRGAFRYDHDPERLSSGYPILPASTPAAIFALSLLGLDAGGEELAAPRRFVLARIPDGYRYTGDADFVSRARGNLYFWYYATLAMFRAGGREWEAWNTALKETLLPAQAPDGSWRPIDTYSEYAGDDDAERTYTTAMCVLSLEVYYRYFTPLLQVR